jgi:hypothetical protein
MPKPQILKIKEYMAQVEELNKYLKMFLGYHNGMELQDDELLVIYEFGVPTSWKKQFLVHNWDPIQHSKQEFCEFCEWLETAKSISQNIFQVKNNSNGSSCMPVLTSAPINYGGRVTTSAPTGNNALKFCTT